VVRRYSLIYLSLCATMWTTFPAQRKYKPVNSFPVQSRCPILTRATAAPLAPLAVVVSSRLVIRLSLPVLSPPSLLVPLSRLIPKELRSFQKNTPSHQRRPFLPLMTDASHLVSAVSEIWSMMFVWLRQHFLSRVGVRIRRFRMICLFFLSTELVFFPPHTLVLRS
jgi:hypothetical protein